MLSQVEVRASQCEHLIRSIARGICVCAGEFLTLTTHFQQLSRLDIWAKPRL